MKNTVLRWIFAFVGLGMVQLVLGQDWAPIPNATTLYFNYHDTQINIKGFAAAACDSVVTEGADTAHYLYRVDRPDMINQQGLNCNNQNTSITYWPNADHFWGKKILRQAQGYCLFISSDADTVTLRSWAGFNESWAWDDNLTATISFVGDTTIFGQQDSIKHITLSNGKTLILSKRHGLVRTYTIFEPTAYGMINQPLKLWGIPERSLGGKLPGYDEICEFDVGDIFGRSDTYNSFPFGGQTIASVLQYRIDSAYQNAGDWTYHAKATGYKTVRIGSDPIVRIDYNAVDTVISFPRSWYAHADLLPHQHRPVASGMDFHRIQTGFFAHYLDTLRISQRFFYGHVLDTCLGTFQFGGLVTGDEYLVEGLGRFELSEMGADWSDHKRTNCYRTALSDYGNCDAFDPLAAVSPADGAASMVVYPNPIAIDHADALHVVFSGDRSRNQVKITLTGIDGRALLSQTYPAGIRDVTVPVSHAAPGIYLLVIQEKGHAPVAKKVSIFR